MMRVIHMQARVTRNEAVEYMVGLLLRESERTEQLNNEPLLADYIADAVRYLNFQLPKKDRFFEEGVE